ncbi:phenylalanine racemase [Listeria sp. FSL L7-1485]|uniref:Phenylalanine racemase n=2 Tax=Listeriaceae TaxID=186820 RepID=A0A7X0X5A0_9LIST|nr:phenylalanine racemase [Listeria immobilis]MBK1966108.1 phenylalanine racemase [Listeria ivanovii subsp. londoniensis]MBC1487648.1 phenylalanine racemase [Listeria immobilis]MBC1507722.1 phenylalanine racemase [Listeria immobilis]MBC1510717.1 phenylalanine racemase [Listeria immobilis]
MEFEYFGAEDGETANETNNDFELEKQLAFFVVNFHMTKHDFEELTEIEKNFIMKEWENKVIFESTMMRNAVLNAEQNLNRKRNSRFIDLHKKRQKKADVNYTVNALQAISENEEQEGKGWIDRIYQANGLQKPKNKKERGKINGG